MLRKYLNSYYFLGLVFISLACIFRLAWPGFILFGTDQVSLQSIADRFFATGTWPLVGLVGTKGVFYGPLPSWIYIVIRSIVPDQVPLDYWLFYCVSAIHLCAIAYFLLGLRFVLTKATWLLIFGFILSSPLLTLYARQLWDNTFLISLTCLFSGYYFRKIHGFRSSQQSSIYLWIIGGLCAGAAISIHLMALPFVLGIFYACWSLSSQETKNRKSGILLFAIFGLMFVGPYVYGFLTTEPPPSDVSTRAFNPIRWFLGVRSLVIQWSHWFSWSGFLNYFVSGQEIQTIQKATGASSNVAFVIYCWTIVLQFLMASLCVTAIAQWLRARTWNISSTQIQLLAFMATLGFGHVTLSVFGDATAHPHYFQAVWWIPFVTLGLWIDLIAKPRLKRFAVITTGFLIGTNWIMTPIMGLFFLNSGGSPSRYIGPSFRVQQEAVKALCRTERTYFDICPNSELVTHAAVYWLARHLSQCNGKIFEETKNSDCLTFTFVMEPKPHVEWNIHK